MKGTWIIPVIASILILGSLGLSQTVLGQNTNSVTPDHYLGYDVKETKDTPKFDKRDVDLTDQFGTGIFEVKKPKRLYNPVDKNGEGISDLFTHLVGYKISIEDDEEEEEENEVIANVLVTNQFGDIILDVQEEKLLLVPSAKNLDFPPEPLDFTLVNHYKCYEVEVTEGTPEFEKIIVSVFDPNFDEQKILEVKKPKLLCNPVDKNGEGIIDEENHLLCYKVKLAKDQPKHEKRKSVFTNNQFGPEQLDTKKEKELCVPSMKILLDDVPTEPQCPQPQGFDVLPDGTAITGSFANPRQVTTEWEPCGIALLTSTDPGGPQLFNFATTGKSPPNQLAGCCGAGQFFQPIGVEFTQPVSSASIKGLGVGCRGLILEGFNSANVLVASDSVVGTSSGTNNVDLLSISGSGIVRLDIRQVFPTLVCGFVLDGYSIDDLSYIFE